MRGSRLSTVLLITMFSAAVAHAQGSAVSTILDPSIRSAGMGGASNAVFWGGDPNYWANPALLGYHQGLRVLWGKTQLVPDLASDVTFETRRFTLGYGGIGVASAGKLDDGGFLHLSYGRSEGVDENGNPTGTFESFEEIHSLGVGASVSRIAETQFRAARQRVPLIFRMADFAAGYNEKDVRVSLAPGYDASTSTKDRGIFGRISVPIPVEEGAEAPAWFDVAVGHSILNYDDAYLVFINAQFATPTTRVFRDGVAARLSIASPRHMRETLDTANLHWLGAGLEPFVSLGAAFDRERIQGGSFREPHYDVERWGVELTLANLVALRAGHVTDRSGDIDGYSWGVGVGADLGFGGVRYDHAEIPQATGLSNVTRDGVTAYIDPFALIAAMR